MLLFHCPKLKNKVFENFRPLNSAYEHGIYSLMYLMINVLFSIAVRHIIKLFLI